MVEGKTTKYFKYAIGEIILVVIGILIALQINNWNEARKLAKQETLYLQRLISESQQNIQTFEGFIADLTKGNETGVNLSNALKNEASADSIILLTAKEYFQFGSIYPIFSTAHSTFDDLSNTGNLSVISNALLREKVARHYALYNQTNQRINIGIDWALPLDTPFTVDNNIMRFEPNTTFLFPEQPIEALSAEIKLNKLEYISNVAAHYWINKDAIAQLEVLIKETIELIEDLQKELN